MVRKEIKRNQRKVKIRNEFRKFLNKTFKKNYEMEEIPQVYSNIPLAIPYIPLTEDLLLRRKRFYYKSVIYVNEASLLADSKTLEDEIINKELLLFFKLIGHSTKGGCVVLDTHTIGDLHVSEKRTTSEYFYIHHLTKWIPFFLIAKVQECRYSNDNSTIFAQTKDIEDELKTVIIPKSTWKYFDAYCYSALTDNLPIENNLIENTTDLKARKIITFNRGLDKLLKTREQEIQERILKCTFKEELKKENKENEKGKTN